MRNGERVVLGFDSDSESRIRRKKDVGGMEVPEDREDKRVESI